MRLQLLYLKQTSIELNIKHRDILRKEELMLKLRESGLFNEDELHAINKRVEKHKELERENILKLWGINEME